MLSSVLNSDKAIVINIAIIRIFTKLRSFLLLEKGLSERIDKLESGTNKVFKAVFERLDSIEEVIDTKLPTTKRKIGLKNSLSINLMCQFGTSSLSSLKTSSSKVIHSSTPF